MLLAEPYLHHTRKINDITILEEKTRFSYNIHAASLTSGQNTFSLNVDSTGNNSKKIK